MLTTYFDIRPKIAERIDNYAEYLFNNSDYSKNICWDIRQRENPDLLSWKNPENIDSGICGVLVFLMEVYKETRQQKYLELIDRSIGKLLIYCKNNPTSNYSLYTGRAGVVYLLLQRYSINNDKLWINESLKLIKRANKEYLLSRYVSDYLYDGRAGTLLTILYLYLISKNEFLLEYIDQFILKIISNAQFSDGGVFWISEYEFHLKPSCSFGHGVSGIKYVFNQINQYFRNPGLEFIISQIEKFTNSCWIKDFNNWGNFRRDIHNIETLNKHKETYLKFGDAALEPGQSDTSWIHGTTGILCSYLNQTDNKSFQLLNEKLAETPIEWSTDFDNLYNGKLAIQGLYFLELYNMYGDDRFQEKISQIVKRIALEQEDLKIDGGLFHGDLGKIYFLLKAMSKEKRSENILIPFFYSQQASLISVKNLSIDLKQVTKDLLAKHFARTINVLSAVAGPQFLEYLESFDKIDGIGAITKFIDFMEHTLHVRTEAPSRECLEDVFYFEKAKLGFCQSDKRSSFQIYLDLLSQNDKVSECLNRPDDWLFNQKISISNSIKIARTKWDWGLSDNSDNIDSTDVLKKHLLNLNSPPGDFEYIFQISYKQANVETDLKGVFRVLLHQFDTPKPLHEIMNEIRYYIQLLPEDLLESMLIDAELPNVSKNDLIQFYGNEILSKIRNWIHRSILIIN